MGNKYQQTPVIDYFFQWANMNFPTKSKVSNSQLAVDLITSLEIMSSWHQFVSSPHGKSIFSPMNNL